MTFVAQQPASRPSPASSASAMAPSRNATIPMLATALHDVAEQIAGLYHPAPFSAGLCMALTVLWSRLHKFDAADPRWPDRDRFLLSDAAALPLLRALLQITGHGDFDPGLKPPLIDPDHHPCLEGSVAPAGQTIAIAAGLAMGERLMAARFGKSLVDHRVWVAATASELDQGLTHEAISLAGQLRLDRLVLLVDATADHVEDARGRVLSCGWAVKTTAADDPQQIEAALSFALRSRKPTLVWCAAGGRPSAARPTVSALDAWQRTAARGLPARRAWLKRIARHPQRKEFERAVASRLPDHWLEPLTTLKQRLKATQETLSPADTCRETIDRLVAAIPELLCLHVRPRQADAHGIPRPGVGQRRVDAGRRPFAAAAFANGIAQHGGTLALTTADYADINLQLPALLLAAGQRRHAVHLAMETDATPLGSASNTTDQFGWLRAVPYLRVLRPACPMEVADCLELAIRRGDGPSLVILSASPRPPSRTDMVENPCARGGYVLAEADGPRRATLIASGADITAALQLRDVLATEGIPLAVVSLPCWALLDAQTQAYRDATLGSAPRIALERTARTGWSRYLREIDRVITCDGFSLPALAREIRAVTSA